jgi:hypothetical protein
VKYQLQRFLGRRRLATVLLWAVLIVLALATLSPSRADTFRFANYDRNDPVECGVEKIMGRGNVDIIRHQRNTF